MTESTVVQTPLQSSPVAWSFLIPGAGALALAIALGMSPAARVRVDEGRYIRTDIDDTGNHSVTIATRAAMQERLAKLQASVEQLKSLEANWDGEGAAAPNPDHVDALMACISALPLDLSTFRPMLASDGEIGVYWQRADSYAELSIDEQGEMSLYLRSLKSDSGRIFEVGPPYILDAALVREIQEQLA